MGTPNQAIISSRILAYEPRTWNNYYLGFAMASSFLKYYEKNGTSIFSIIA